MKTFFCSSRREEAHFSKMFYAHPHPDPLPRGEGTAVGHFVSCESFSSRLPRSICQMAGNISPSPWGEGRGEGGWQN
jgi:hypothetical protein